MVTDKQSTTFLIRDILSYPLKEVNKTLDLHLLVLIKKTHSYEKDSITFNRLPVIFYILFI